VLSLDGKTTHEVVINAVEAFAQMEEKFRAYVENTVSEQVSVAFKTKLPDAERLSEKAHLVATLYWNGAWRGLGAERFSSTWMPRSRNMHALESVRRS